MNYRIAAEVVIPAWNKAIDSTDPEIDNWRNFVISTFDLLKHENVGYKKEYSTYSGEKKLINLTSTSKHDPDSKYQFLSEKLYNRLMNLRKKMIQKAPEHKDHFRLPNGYKKRAGDRFKGRMSIDDMIAIMMTKDTSE